MWCAGRYIANVLCIDVLMCQYIGGRNALMYLCAYAPAVCSWIDELIHGLVCASMGALILSTH